MTNTQSNLDGTLTEDDIGWLLPRAEADFGMVMTAAAYVSPPGRAWEGQLGISDDAQLPGLERLATALRRVGAASVVQLHHGGYRAEASLTGERVSAFAFNRARAMSTEEIQHVVNDFAIAAVRAERAGFDGAEIHGAHGYLLCQFLERANQRNDGYGGDLASRSRILHETIDAIRAATSSSFQLGIRLSAGSPAEAEDSLSLTEGFLVDSRLDYVDASVWDYRRLPDGASLGSPSLTQLFTRLRRDGVALGITGRIRSTADVHTVLDAGADFVAIGRAAIADHRFAQRCIADPTYRGPTFPVTQQQLRDEHLGEAFVQYFTRGWPDYVAD